MNNYISQTQINTYINCSKRYYWRYILNTPPSNETKIEGRVIGSYIHKVMEKKINNLNASHEAIFTEILLENKNWFKEPVDTLTDKNLKEFCKEKMKEYYYKVIFEDEIEVLKTKTNTNLCIYNTSQQLKEIIFKNSDSLFTDFLKIESEIKLEYENILGFLDIIGIDNNFQKVIIDFKTTKKDFKVEKKVQNLLYVWLCYKTTGQIPIFRYIVIKYNNKNFVECEIVKEDLQFHKKDLIIAEDYVENFRKGVTHGVFLRNVESFLCSQDYCEYFKICKEEEI